MYRVKIVVEGVDAYDIASRVDLLANRIRLDGCNPLDDGIVTSWDDKEIGQIETEISSD